MQVTETPLLFECQGKKLVGVIHESDSDSKIGVLIIVGGPQYRVGSHRQFVLLARYLASQSVSTMRFDVRGMGDSDGEQRCFDELDDDIHAAVNCFVANCANVKEVVLWGLCDAASASLFYGYQDSRVKGMVLLNPWVFTEHGAAKTVLKHYYLQRLLSKDFWIKIFAFKFDYAHSMASLLHLLKQAFAKSETSKSITELVKIDESLSLPIRMRECLKKFKGQVLLILSGRDLTADEFKETVKGDPEWQALIMDSRVTRRDFYEADHTFSSADWRTQIMYLTREWINTLNCENHLL